MQAWLRHQVYSLRLSSKRLRAAPLQTLANLLAIGIALCLPLVLWLFVSGLQQALGNLDSEAEVSAAVVSAAFAVFVKMDHEAFSGLFDDTSAMHYKLPISLNMTARKPAAA